MTRWIEHECASLVLLCRHSRRLLAPMQGNTGYEWTAEQHELFLAQAAVFKNLSNPPGFIWAVRAQQNSASYASHSRAAHVHCLPCSLPGSLDVPQRFGTLHLARSAMDM